MLRSMGKRVSLYLVLGLLCIAAPGHAQDAPQPRTLSVATLAPPGSTWMRVFDAWNREVRRRSNGTLQFRFYSGGVQGDEAEVIRKLRNGRLDGAAVTAVGLGEVYRPALVYELPGLFSSYAQLDAARTALQPDMDLAFSRAGYVMLGWADVGDARIFSTKRIASPGDLVRTRAWGWREDPIMPVYLRAGRATIVPLGVPDVLGALQTNRIDTLATPPVAAVSLQWASRISFMTGIAHAMTIGGTVLAKRAFDQLSAEQQTVLRETGSQFHALARRNLRRDEQQAIRALADRNVQTVPVTGAQREEWKRLAAQVRRQLTGQIADQALIDRVQSFGR